MNRGNASARLWPYKAALVSLSPLILVYTLYRSIKDGGLVYLFQRFGFSGPEKATNTTWIHCASVGEVNTALPLIHALLREQPHTRFVVSTTTPTGKGVLLKKAAKRVRHFYLPLDFNHVVKRTLKNLSPQRLILVETELWPNLIHQCHARQIPVSIVNARLSNKTLNTYAWLLAAYSDSLNKIDAVLAKNNAEGEKYLQLGLSASKLHITGSLKFAALESSPAPASAIPQCPFWLAVSTHDDEELRLARQWCAQNREELLIIAPRHPERRAQLANQLRDISPAVQLRSQQMLLNPETRIYIADTFGELESFIRGALVVFVGGSLIPRGGHNIVEAARSGKAVITGPSIDNFLDEFKWLSEHDAIVQVENDRQLIQQLCDLLDNKARRTSLENRARKACALQSDVVNRYLSMLAALREPALPA